MDRKKSPGWRKKDEKKIQMTRADKMLGVQREENGGTLGKLDCDKKFERDLKERAK